MAILTGILLACAAGLQAGDGASPAAAGPSSNLVEAGLDLRAQRADLARALALSVEEFDALFVEDGALARLAGKGAAWRRDAQKILDSYRGPAGLERDACLCLLLRDQRAQAARILRTAGTPSPRLAWMLVNIGARLDRLELTDLADLCYGRVEEELARAGVRKDVLLAVAQSPLLWLFKPIRHHAELGHGARVEALYAWMQRLCPASELLYGIHLRAAQHFDSLQRPGDAARARQAALALYDDAPQGFVSPATMHVLDLSLLVVAAVAAVLLLVLAALWLKYRRCRRLALATPLASGGRVAGAIRWFMRPPFAFATHGELTALLALLALGITACAVTHEVIAGIGRGCSLPIELLGGQWTHPGAIAYLERMAGEPATDRTPGNAGARAGTTTAIPTLSAEQRSAAAYLLAYATLDSGRSADAARRFASLVAGGGALERDREAWLNLGTALWRLGRAGEAREAWERSRTLGSMWADFNLGPRTVAAPAQDFIAPIARWRDPGQLAIPPGPERIAQLLDLHPVLSMATVRRALRSVVVAPVRFIRSWWSFLVDTWLGVEARYGAEHRALASALAGDVASAIVWLGPAWLVAVILVGLLLPSPVRRCGCGEPFIASRATPRCDACTLELAWSDADLLESPRGESLAAFALRHLVALLVPGLKPLMSGSPLLGTALLLAATLGQVCTTALSYTASRAVGFFGMGAMPSLDFMFGPGWSLAWEPFGATYCALVPWLVPIAYLFNALWLLALWRKEGVAAGTS